MQVETSRLQTTQTKQPKKSIYSPNSVSQEIWVSISWARFFCPQMLADRFNQTIKMLMSAGDTPEIRAAWPIVVGRILANFCRASRRRLGTAEKSNVLGIDLSSSF